MQKQFDLIKTWKEIQQKLKQNQQVSVSLVNNQGKLLTQEAGIPSLCARFQKNTEGQNLCSKEYSYQCAYSVKNKLTTHVFFCHAGLINFIFPLLRQDQIIGAIVGGRVIVKKQNKPESTVEFSTQGFQQMVKEIEPLLGKFARLYEKQSLVLKNDHLENLINNNTPKMRDEATGLYNRQYLLSCLQQELSLDARQHISVCLLMLQLTGLEGFDQKTCDLKTKNMADLLGKVMRKYDVITKYDDNVLALLLFNSGQREGLKTANRLSKLKEYNKFPANFQLGLFAATKAHCQAEALADSIQAVLKSLEFGNKAQPVIAPRNTIYPAKNKKRRVVITGIGVVSPLGCDKQVFAQALSEGRSGIKRLTLFDPTEFSSQIGGEVHNFPVEKFIESNKLGKIGRATSFVIGAAKMAIIDAGLDLRGENPQRVGVTIGSAVAGLEFGELQIYNLLKFGADEISPYLAINIFGGAISSETSIALSANGYCTTLSTGCAAGTDAVGTAFHLIREGKSDVFLAGGADAPINPICFGSFCAIEALSTGFNHCPEKASRPFDRMRSGFVIAEGAGMVVLEELQHALRRGAHIYGEVLGFGSTNDAYHMSQSAPDGEAAANAVRLTLKDAGLEPRHIDYINAHGSATHLNDATETTVIKEVFGRQAYRLAISSTKSMTGHPIGAAGALELIACLLALEKNFIPPTINQEYFDPECDLDYVPNKARKAKLNVVMSNSFGFGGKNACIVVSRY